MSNAIELPPPKAPSGLIKIGRYSFLIAGIIFGLGQKQLYSRWENARRAQEELERPEREAALKAEKDKRIAEEMEYLGRETGVLKKNPSSAAGLTKSAKDHKADCGCKY